MRQQRMGLFAGELPWLLLIGFMAGLVILLDGPVALRAIFGIPLVIFIPGYCLVCALFPSREGLDGLERLALGFGLSLALIPLTALAIEYSPWPLATGAIAVLLLLQMTLFGVAAIWRRSQLASHEQFSPGLAWPKIPSPGKWDRMTSVAALLIAGSVLLISLAGGAIVFERLQGDPMTEFAVYSSDGNPEFYPREFVQGQAETVVLEVTNREGEDEDYRLRIVAGGQEIGEIAHISLSSGATWREPVEVSVPLNGEDIPLQFELYRGTDEGATPYRTLQLMVTSAPS